VAAATRLSKVEFLERVRARSARYGIEFSEVRLNEWIDQALAFPGDREANQGLRPQYTYGFRHYRRALQLVRLYADGVRDRDAILVQLFLRGYSVRPHEIRCAVQQEFRKVRAQLNSTIRSIYMDRDVPIPPRRAEQIITRMGEADSRLREAQIVPTNSLLINVVRVSRDADKSEISWEWKGLSFQEIIFQLAKPLFSGLLYVDNQYPSEVEKLILRGSERQYEIARILVWCIRRFFIIVAMNLPGKIASASYAMERSLTRREFSVFMLTIALRFCSMKEYAPFCTDLDDMLRETPQLGIFFRGKFDARCRFGSFR
jgi:hypothetical protein